MHVQGLNPTSELTVGSAFVRQLKVHVEQITDRDFRRLVLAYCQLYQEVYWFDQLKNAFAYLEMASGDDAGALQSELLTVRAEVEDAMGEYFISLNEFATAIYRLLDEAPFSADDAISCITHIWNARACNEDPADFRQREDQILCELLAQL